jgi:hypothetical protein
MPISKLASNKKFITRIEFQLITYLFGEVITGIFRVKLVYGYLLLKCILPLKMSISGFIMPAWE